LKTDYNDKLREEIMNEKVGKTKKNNIQKQEKFKFSMKFKGMEDKNFRTNLVEQTKEKEIKKSQEMKKVL
jgi:hypothetical protein